MFTGIIQSIGNITAVESQGADVRVHIATGKLDFSGAQVGDSIAVNGVCLTATSFVDNGFWADVSGETLARTIFGEIAVGRKVNLEQSLTPTTRLGGHLVSGHVDGTGTVVSCWDQGRSLRFVIQAPSTLARYIAEKGSICVDGVSLTVNKVNGACAAHECASVGRFRHPASRAVHGCTSVARGGMPEVTFDLNIVPHTLQETTLSEWVVGSRVNLEVDILARYLERLLLGEGAAHGCASAASSVLLGAAQSTTPQSAGITHGFLVEHGFIKA